MDWRNTRMYCPSETTWIGANAVNRAVDDKNTSLSPGNSRSAGTSAPPFFTDGIDNGLGDVDPRSASCRTRTVWQYRYVPSLSGLLPTLPGISRIRLPSAPIEPLRRLDGGVLSPPHGHEAPRGARFPRSACASYDRGGRPLDPEASGVHTTDENCPAAACRSSTARPCTPVSIPSPGALGNEASAGVHSRSPVRSSPRLRTRMERARFGFFPELRTPQLPATHVRAGTGLEHWPGATSPTSPAPPIHELTRNMRPRVAQSPPSPPLSG
jgi:hypothetical protein